MDAAVHLFGIRHHGPGSAASLVAALDALGPATVLIEGPPEADALIPYAAAAGMRPPLALLAYAAEDPGSSIFYPLAEFSPEWQALRWALRHGRPARFIDWPAGMALAQRMAARRPPPEAESDGDGAAAVELVAADDQTMERDPLDRLAKISGHADGESLWNALVESRGAGIAVFAAVEEAMTALRAESESAPDAEASEAAPMSAAVTREARREAHMRLAIRDALKAAEGPVAVVVGAWHVPALRRKVAAATDKALLRAAARVKVEVSWVPWTETRLAAASGYGAGVASPGWYGHLWRLYAGDPAKLAPEIFAATWQAKVAALLRAEGQPASSAAVIEAARLALGLAALRGEPAPGLDDMRDASLATLCHGDETPFRLIETRLVIGEAVGEVDESVPQMPLAADLARWQRRLRLKPEALDQEMAFDLRSEAGLAKSILLHRLELLGMPWGRLIDAGAGRGTFREIWRLAWAPELSVSLAEALVHGVTIEQAAAGAAAARAGASAPIMDLADLVRRCLLADLPAAAEQCIAALQAAAVHAADVTALMTALPPLVSILRYGTARKMPQEALTALASSLAAEVNAGIGHAASHLDAEAAQALRGAMANFDPALTLLADEHLIEEWTRRLGRLVDDAATVPLIAGLALRLRHDRAALEPAAIAAAFSRALSPAVPPKDAGEFLEGFLGGGAEVILQDPVLFGLIDGWLGEQPEQDFIELLPMLRRAFASFGASERKRLLAEVGKPRAAVTQAAEAGDSDAPGFAQALPLLLTILGISRHE
jgi:hypothetical protein